MIKKKQSLDTWIKHPQPQPPPRPSSSIARLPLPHAPSPRPTKEPRTQSHSIPAPIPRPRVHPRPYTVAANTKATFKWMRGELLGSGSYGRVYLAMNVATGELMAVKQVEIYPGEHKQDALKYLAFESETLKDLDHPNIVQYLGYEKSTEALSVFLEYVPGGTIASLLHTHGAFREEVTKSFTKQILQGLEYLHTHQIIHRDLKPDNILVEPRGICKISDFGISKRVEDINSAKAHTLLKGTVHYMAPEILGSEEKKYGGKIDIWSVGCMVTEMWTGEKPWGKELFIQIMIKLQETRSSPPLPSELQKELSPEARNFREACFHINPIERPVSSELKEHPYLVLPFNWIFDGSQISHPSRGKSAKNKQRPNKNGHTLRSVTQNLDYSDPNSTVKPDETTFKGDGQAIKLPPRGPSPPIVFIEPPRPREPPPQRIPSPTDLEPDYATSVSSTTSYSRRPRRKYVVNNPNPEEDSAKSFRYYPPELPAVSTPRGNPYSSQLGTSSKYNLSYSAAQSGSPHDGRNPTGNETPYSVSEKPSRNVQPTVLTSSNTNISEDNRTWKKLPTTSPIFRHRTNSSSSSASSYTRSEHLEHLSPSKLQRTGDRLQSSSSSPIMPIVPPPPTVPPPRPPLNTQTSSVPLQIRTVHPSPFMQTRPNTQTRRDISQKKIERLEDAVQNRPGADVIVRHLGEWFRNHDLDDPVVIPAASVDDLTVNSNPDITGGNLLSYNPINQPNDQSSSASLTRDRRDNIQSSSRKLAPTKSIRKIAEERQSIGHPRRRSLWDFKMEELKTPAPLTPPFFNGGYTNNP